MKIIDYTTARERLGDSRSAKDFMSFLGQRPERLGMVANLYSNNSVSHLTEGLMNVYFNSKGGKHSFQPINSMSFEWEIGTNFIKKVYFASSTTDSGADGRLINLIFTEKYFDIRDTIKLQNSQVLTIMSKAERLSAKEWKYTARFNTTDLSKGADINFMTKGKYARLLANAHPEGSERGYAKYQSSFEKHRNHITRHRCDEYMTDEYALTSDTYFEMEKGKGKEPEYFKITAPQETALKSFMQTKNYGLLFNKSNFDKFGKCLMQDEQGRDLPQGDGIIPQIERYCEKFYFTKLTESMFKNVIITLGEKSEQTTNNHYTFVCNDKMYAKVMNVLSDTLKSRAIDGTYYWSRTAGKQVKVGAWFTSYEYMGNTITFTVDKALHFEYPDKAYGIWIDMTPDLTKGKPAIATFTLSGGEMITGTIKGLGGIDGKTSGEVSTTIAGSGFLIQGYSGVAVFNPYRAAIMQEL